jgi:hypothetical protein
MTMAERITELLIRHNGQAFCDDCLRRTLKTSSAGAVERATKAMAANPAYQRQPMICARCANERPTIRALWPEF